MIIFNEILIFLNLEIVLAEQGSVWKLELGEAGSGWKKQTDWNYRNSMLYLKHRFHDALIIVSDIAELNSHTNSQMLNRYKISLIDVTSKQFK